MTPEEIASHNDIINRLIELTDSQVLQWKHNESIQYNEDSSSDQQASTSSDTFTVEKDVGGEEIFGIQLVREFSNLTIYYRLSTGEFISLKLSDTFAALGESLYESIAAQIGVSVWPDATRVEKRLLQIKGILGI